MAKKSGLSLSLVGGSAVVILLGAAIAASVATPACSSKFSDCSDSYTCPSGGAGGSAGLTSGGSAGLTMGGTAAGGTATGGASGMVTDAGAAGIGGQPECVVDADCDDHDPCTATDECKDSVCVHADSPCTNPDAKNCDEICSNSGGKAKCTTVGLDADGDAHLSAACAAAPGDDCDDSNPNVHPGAKEICDGIDNDCNGAADAFDRLPISGQNQDFANFNHATTSAVAWDPKSATYGVAWLFYADSDKSASLAFASFDTKGAIVVAPKLVESASIPGTADSGAYLSIAAGNGEFGIFWVGGAPTHVASFNRVSPSGVVNPTVLRPVPANGLAAQQGRLAYLADGWLLALLEHTTSGTFTSSIGAQRIDVNGALTTIAPLVPTALRVNFDLAWNKNQIVLSDLAAKSDSVTGFVSIGRGQLNGGLFDYATEQDPAYSDLLAGDDNGFALVWTTKAGDAMLQMLDAKGVNACGPKQLPLVPTSLIATGNGYLLSNGLKLMEASQSCDLTTIAQPAQPPDASSSLAGTAKTGFAAVWVQAGAIYYRVMGPHLCD